jgi:tryptophan synthase beta chain
MFEYHQPDARGHFGPVNGTQYGGTFVAETLIHALHELEAAYATTATTPSLLPSTSTS